MKKAEYTNILEIHFKNGETAKITEDSDYSFGTQNFNFVRMSESDYLYQAKGVTINMREVTYTEESSIHNNLSKEESDSNDTTI